MINRRTFLGFLSSLVATPLVAKDMGDFEFLPPPVLEPTNSRPILPVTGALRYNETTQQFEIYQTNRWEVLVSMEKYQNV